MAAPTATAVPAITNLAARGLHICTITTANTVSCWGGNDRGQLGLGDTKNRGDLPHQMGDALPFLQFGKGRQGLKGQQAFIVPEFIAWGDPSAAG